MMTFSLFYNVQTCPGSHTDSYPVGLMINWPELDTDHLQIIERSRIMTLNLHSPYVFMK
jgi:hypothetical protein